MYGHWVLIMFCSQMLRVNILTRPNHPAGQN
jgi:hypothetical protein